MSTACTKAIVSKFPITLLVSDVLLGIQQYDHNWVFASTSGVYQNRSTRENDHVVFFR